MILVGVKLHSSHMRLKITIFYLSNKDLIQTICEDE